ncbi:hypothetical protein, partial [Rothia nasimurium]
MDGKKLKTGSMPGINDDATEVLPALSHPSSADAFGQADDDATVVLPRRSSGDLPPSAPAPQGQDPDATTVLPTRPLQTPGPYDQDRFE